MLLRKEEKIQNFLLDNPNKITPQRMALNKKVYSINLRTSRGPKICSFIYVFY